MGTSRVGFIVLAAATLAACQTGGSVSNSKSIEVSDNLAAALTDFRPFLLADDVERSDKVAASDSETLRGLVDAVEPLFDQINATLDATNEKSSLSDEEQDLESDLHSLAQAAEEARIELESRGDKPQLDSPS